MHILIAIVVVAVIAGLVIRPLGRPKEKLQAVWPEMTASFHPSRKDSVTPFKAWAATALGQEPQLQAWLTGLPDEGLRALVEKLAEFCTEMDMDMELEWLFTPEPCVTPAAKAAAGQVVTDYCKICLKAVQRQQAAV